MRKLLEEFKRSILPLSFIIIIAPLGGMYKLLNGRTAGAYNVETWIDARIPFSKIFIIPYVAWYGYIFLLFVYLCLKNRKVYYKTLLSYNIGEIACFIVYLFFQTTITRPAPVGDDILTRIILIIYGADQPYNCLPSIHVLSTLIIMFGLHLSREINWKVILGSDLLGILIILSTVFVKQHAFLDIVAGAGMAVVVFAIVYVYVDAARVFLWPVKKLAAFSPGVRRILDSQEGEDTGELKEEVSASVDAKEEDFLV